MLRVAPSSTLFPYTTLFRSEMPVGGERCAEGLEDPYLFRRVRDVVVATQDVGDGVEPVLDRGGEVVGGAAVGPDDHKVLEPLVRVFDPAADQVVPGGDALVGHSHADGALVLVGLLLRDQAPSLLAAALHPIELERDLAVPVEPEPAQRLLDLLRRLRDLAAGVGVLDPEVELSPFVTREEPVEKRGVDASDMEEAGGARREADADGHAASVLA